MRPKRHLRTYQRIEILEFRESISAGFRDFFNFRDRSCRSEFWYWFLFTLIGYIGLGILSIVAGLVGVAMFGLFVFITIIPGIAVTVRRLHDIGKSGWWYLFLYSPDVISALINKNVNLSATLDVILSVFILAIFVLFIVWMTRAGEPTQNKWGNNPLG